MQIIVYTGAIMMLFLFVLMLVGRDASDSLVETLRGQRSAAVLLGIGFAVLVGAALGRAFTRHHAGGPATAERGRRTSTRSPTLIFTKYLFAFELTSALLITAAVGAMVLAHVERAHGDQARPAGDGARRGCAPGTTAAPMPGPGVFATGQLGGHARRCCRTARVADRSRSPRSIDRHAGAELHRRAGRRPAALDRRGTRRAER